MGSNIKRLNVTAYQGTTIYKYLVDGVVWEYRLDSALDPNVERVYGLHPGRAYNYVKEFGTTITRNGVEVEPEKSLEDNSND